jgi:hypothetical protein
VSNSHHEDTHSSKSTPGSLRTPGTETRRKFRNLVWGGWQILYDTLKEIFDEDSYRRFLERTCSSRSRESYREFMRERETASAQKPRCC